jgi:hypothetical protein
VLRRVQSTKDKHKLRPPWEGPFIIAQVLRLGDYKVKNEKGEVYTNTWTSNNYVVSIPVFFPFFCFLSSVLGWESLGVALGHR